MKILDISIKKKSNCSFWSSHKNFECLRYFINGDINKIIKFLVMSKNLQRTKDK